MPLGELVLATLVLIAPLSRQTPLQTPLQTPTSKGRVYFATTASPGTVFVRQQVSYVATLQLREAAPPRFLTPPQYTPSDVTGAEVYHMPLDTVRAIRHMTKGKERFTQYTYHSALFPLTAGIDTIPPATLTYTLLNEADPYASSPTTVYSAPQRVVVLPLPPQGRPADFSGAVGQFTLAAVADSQGLRTGNAFGLRVRVTGTGDLALLPRPALTIPWATVVSTTDSIMWDSTGTLMHGSKEFRWLVTPQSGGHLRIPPLRYSYFNPTTQMYETATATTTPLTVAGDSVPLPRQDRLAPSAFATLRPQGLRLLSGLVLGGLVLAGVIVWGAGRRRRLHNP